MTQSVCVLFACLDHPRFAEKLHFVLHHDAVCAHNAQGGTVQPGDAWVRPFAYGVQVTLQPAALRAHAPQAVGKQVEVFIVRAGRDHAFATVMSLKARGVPPRRIPLIVAAARRAGHDLRPEHFFAPATPDEDAA